MNKKVNTKLNTKLDTKLNKKLPEPAFLKRLPNGDFNRDVSAVAMDDRFYLIGQVDGTLAAVYITNGRNVFKTSISSLPIIAVACEEKDDSDNQIFYAGDEEGNLYTVDKKGTVVKTANIPESKGNIHVIANKDKYQITVYTCKGSQSLSHTTTDFIEGNFTTSTANYSLDGDGTFHKKKGTGDYDVIQFNARTPSKVVACIGMEFGKKVDDYEEVHAYAIVDDDYENLIEDGTADKKLKVYSNGKLVRDLEFKSPVKQIMSCRHHEGKAQADDIYFLTWNGIVHRVNGTKLADPKVGDKDLEMVEAVKMKGDEEDDDRRDFEGFCVYNDKVAVFGDDGVHVADVNK